MFKKQQWLQKSVAKACTWHFAYVVLHMLLIIIFDSWNLLSHKSVGRRWTLVGILLVINAIAWYLARNKYKNQVIYKVILMSIVGVDLLLAAMYVYWERGMASPSVAMFAVPIILSAVLYSRGLLILTSILASAGYSMATVRYFNDNYGEGIRVQLYGMIFFYCMMFIFSAWLMILAFHQPKES